MVAIPSRSEPARRTAVVVAGFCAMLNLYAPQAILPMLSHVFSVTPVHAALALTTTTLAVALTAPLAGAMSDACGRKPVIVAALACIAVPTVASAFCVSFPLLLTTRLLQGLFMPAVFTATLAYISEEWDSAMRGRVTAWYVTANVSGGFAGRFIGGLAAEASDWRAAFLVLGALNLTGALLVALLMAPSVNFRRASSLSRSIRSLPEHLAHPRLLAAFAVGFNVLFSQVALFTYVTFRLAGAPFNLPPAALGALFSTYLIGIVVTPVAGRVIDRLGQRRTLMYAMPVTIVGTAITLSTSFGVILAGLSLCCIGTFIAQATATSFVAHEARTNKSSATGLYLSCYYAGGGLGAFLPGLAYVRYGWPACVAMAVAVQSIVIALAFFLWRDAMPVPRTAHAR